MSTADKKDNGASRVLRRHAEQQFAEELDELKKADTRQRPAQCVPTLWAARWKTALP